MYAFNARGRLDLEILVFENQQDTVDDQTSKNEWLCRGGYHVSLKIRPNQNIISLENEK